MKLSKVGKRYGRGRWVLTDVDLEVSPGEVVAVTGGNGSGKSTLLRMLVGLARPTTGTITARPEVVGYVPDRFPPAERLSADAYLAHMGRIQGMSTAAARSAATGLLERLALVGGSDTPLYKLSKGNAQKVAVAQALLVTPRLLVLDEPWSGLDASAHGVLGEIIAEVAGAGGSVVFTDHRESVTRANSTVTYAIDAGRLSVLANDRPTESTTTVVLDGARGRDARRWSQHDGVLATDVRGDQLTVRVAEGWSDAFLMAALNEGWSVREVRPDTATQAAPGHTTAGGVR